MFASMMKSTVSDAKDLIAEMQSNIFLELQNVFGLSGPSRGVGVDVPHVSPNQGFPIGTKSCNDNDDLPLSQDSIPEGMSAVEFNTLCDQRDKLIRKRSNF